MPDQQRTYQIVKFEDNNPFFFRIHRRNKSNQVQSKMILEHWHKGLELNYICRGPTDYIIDGVTYRCQAGDVCLINSGSIHSITKHITELDDEVDAFTLIVDYDFLQALVPDIDVYTFDLPEEHIPAIRSCLLKLCTYYENVDYQFRAIALNGALHELIFLLCEFCMHRKSLIEEKSQRHIVHVRKIMEYVEQHYQEPANQAEVAKKLGFSREHFCRYFKQYTGITFREYMTRYRLDRAKRLLETCDDTGLAIALNTGFSNIKQFSSAFKKYYGVTPGQYRKSIALTLQ